MKNVKWTKSIVIFDLCSIKLIPNICKMLCWSRTISLSFHRGQSQRIYLPKIENLRMWQQQNKWRQIEMLSVYLKLCGLTRQDRLPIGSFSTKSTLSWRPSGGNPKHSKIGNACCLPPYSIVLGCNILSTNALMYLVGGPRPPD